MSWIAEMGFAPMPVDADHGRFIGAELSWVATTEDGSVCAVVEMEPDAGDWTVFNVAVGRLFQGKGLGPYMLAFAERVGAERGHSEIRLYTNRRMTRNIELYRRLGYSITGERTNSKRPGHFIVDMAKKLAD
jgi:ribosomal protein S18 acetylase RimI-like enzyme